MPITVTYNSRLAFPPAHLHRVAGRRKRYVATLITGTLNSAWTRTSLARVAGRAEVDVAVNDEHLERRCVR